MVKQKMKAEGANLLAQVNAGSEFTAVVDENGTIFIPLVTVSALKGGAAEPPKKRETTTTEETPESTGTVKKKRGVASEEAPAADEEGEEEAPTPRGKKKAAKEAEEETEEGGVDEAAVKKLFAALDGGKKSDEEVITELQKMTTDKAVKSAVKKVVAVFMGDSKMTTEQVTKNAIAALNGEAAPASEPGTRTAKKKAGVKVEELENGDEITLLLTGEDEDSGEPVAERWGATVKKGRGGKITFTFEDGDVQDYDPEVHSEIQRA